uniref:GG13654 n=1 Tax=Drosophila erecta TaxID=7220 RepID=B3P2Q5_DROER
MKQPDLPGPARTCQELPGPQPASKRQRRSGHSDAAGMQLSTRIAGSGERARSGIEAPYAVHR